MAHYLRTTADANLVSRWQRAGIGPERIAKRVGVTKEVLENNFPFELGYTEEESLAVVADVAFQMATSGENASMTKFWLEARGGWRPGMGDVGAGQLEPLQLVLDGEVVKEEEEAEDAVILEFTPKEDL